MARFFEVFRCVGVDEDANPPAMLLAPHQSRLVALADGDGFSVKPRHSAIKVTEILDPQALIAIRNDFHNTLMQPGVDEKLRSGFMPDIVFSSRGPTRYFSVEGGALVGPPATFIDAKSKGRSTKDDTMLQVVVVKEKKIKLAIRNLQVAASDTGTALVNHANKPSVPEKDVASMNAVWTPQANIVFDLVSSDPLVIDDRLEAIRKELSKAFGLKDGTIPEVGEVIAPHKLVDMIVSRNKTSAEFTIIVARKAIDSSNDVTDGITIPSGGFAVVTDHRDLTTMAHEAGHYIGGRASKSGWVDEPDWTTNNIRLLMRGLGAGFKIPFEFAMKCRQFPAKS